jgi:uncharacterized damage-inducible protein DinB
MIQSVNAFIEYFEGIHRRTVNFIRAVPSDRIDWAPKEGEFSCGDIVRHLAAAEKMFGGAAVKGHWAYSGHDRSLAGSLDEATVHLEACHSEAMTALRGMDDAELPQPRPTLNGPPVKAWRLLMAMVEHEVHHRSQLATYLALLGVEPPQIYGLGIEDVVALSAGKKTWSPEETQ